MSNNNSPIVSTRTTFCGVTVFLHADGSISDRMRYLTGGKLPTDSMWRAWEDVCLYTHSELPAFTRAVKSGTWAPFRIWEGPTEAKFEAACAARVRPCGFGTDGVFRRWA